MDFRELTNKARTCRRFVEDQPLSLADLEWLVDCARLTPSARNAQELRFSLVAQGDTCKKLFALTRWAGALKDWGGPHPGEQPTGFVTIFMPQAAGELTFYDVGIAAQTIQLAASSRGWGCCIIKSFDHQAVPALLQAPAELKPALVLGLGVAKETRVVAPLPADGNTAYWRDAQGLHFVPKRNLDDLIIGRF